MYQNHNKKEIWQIRAMMAAWTVIVCIGVAVFFGLTDDLGDPYPVEESAPTETVQTEPVPEQPELPVSEAQAEHLLSPLYQAMKSEDLAAAAAVLNGEEAEFQTLCEETLAGELWLYYEEEVSGVTIRYMEPLKEASQAEGLVLSKYHTAFYGTFSEGKPEGNGTAIQTAVVEEPRYSYAKGNWTQGKLNGEGETGYRYYETVPAGGYAGIKKPEPIRKIYWRAPSFTRRRTKTGTSFSGTWKRRRA